MRSNTLLSVLTVSTTLVGLCTGCQPDPVEQKRLAGMASYIEGYHAFQEGDRDAAVRALLTAVETNPELITARGMLADIYRHEGQYELAAEQYKTLTNLDPYNYLNFYHLGVSYHFLDRIRSAVEAYHGALRLRPDDPRSNMNLGLAYMVLGEADKALPYARRAVELNGDSPAAWGNYALVLDSLGQHGQAEAAYRRSLEMDPTQIGVRVNYSANLIRQGRPGEAVSIMQEVVAEQRSVLALRRLGDAYAAAGQPQQAVDQYRAALEINPKYYPAMNAIATVRIQQYEKGLQLDESLRADALEMWRRSLAVHPQQPDVIEKLRRWENIGLFGS